MEWIRELAACHGNFYVTHKPFSNSIFSSDSNFTTIWIKCLFFFLYLLVIKVYFRQIKSPKAKFEVCTTENAAVSLKKGS